MAQGPIPASFIERYAEREGLNREEAWIFKFCIRALDIHHMNRLAKQAEQNR